MTPLSGHVPQGEDLILVLTLAPASPMLLQALVCHTSTTREAYVVAMTYKAPSDTEEHPLPFEPNSPR